MKRIATPVHTVAFYWVGEVSLGTFLRKGMLAHRPDAVLITDWLGLVGQYARA